MIRHGCGRSQGAPSMLSMGSLAAFALFAGLTSCGPILGENPKKDLSEADAEGMLGYRPVPRLCESGFRGVFTFDHFR